MYDNDTFEVQGKTFKVTFPADDMADAPWERSDGHGPVSEWTTRDKRPGERVLCYDGHRGMGSGSCRFYDFQAAVKLARTEWGCKRGKAAVDAAEEDYDRLRRWCNDQWSYVGVEVTLLDDEGEPAPFSLSSWGIESDCEDYLEETARELASEIVAGLEGQNPCGL